MYKEMSELRSDQDTEGFFQLIVEISKQGGDKTSLSNLLHCLSIFMSKNDSLPLDYGVQKAFV